MATRGTATSSRSLPPGQGAALVLSGVHKSFKELHAVKGIDLEVARGEVVALLGPNGAGKTTTIDMVLGLNQPDSGSVEVFSLSPRHAVARGAVAAVLQNGGLLKDFTVQETLRYVAALYPNSRSVPEVTDRAGLTSIADRLVGKCSGGEQQRLRFAMALLPDPWLLILDEPTQGMDVEGRRRFWESIRSEGMSGRTVIFATHYLDEADAYADRVVLMRKGEIVANGTASEVKKRASGRTLRATWRGAQPDALAHIPGVEAVEIRGESVIIQASDTDAIARFLLNQTPARDIEITSRSLEDAFIALTSEDVTR